MPRKTYRVLLDRNGMPQQLYIQIEDSSDGIPPEAIEITHAQYDDIDEHPGRLRWNGRALIGARPGDDHQLYWESLGDFLQSYAHTEGMVLRLLQHFAGVSDEVARAIFSGTRMKSALEFAGRIAEFTNLDDLIRQELTVLAQRLGEITNTRDLIVHFGTRFGQEMVTSNRRVGMGRTLKEQRVSREILWQMKHDLTKATTHIDVLINPVAHDATGPNTPIGSILHAPWLYRPARPVQNPQTHSGRPPKRKRPPKPSGE